MIELLTGRPPYYDLNIFTAMRNIIDKPHPPISEDFSEDLKDFLKLCFEKNPDLRINALGLISHKWLASKDDENNETKL